LRFLARLVRALKPRHVIEFGSGTSTRLLLRTDCEMAVPPHVTSIDHDPEFAVAPEQLSAYSDFSFQYAPVVAREFGGKLLPSYLLNRAAMPAEPPADLVLVDGPPACLGGREGTLYQVMDFARLGTLLLLDDANRPEERAVLAHWEDALGDAIQIRYLSGFAKGMAAVLIREVVPRSGLWSRRELLTTMELSACVPAGSHILLIDQNCFGARLAPERRVSGFIEHENQYVGPPADSDSAIQELEIARQSSARFLAIVWPCFWWFDCYPNFFDHLSSRHERILSNDRLVLFRLL
jgi:hypothetical protein